MVSVSLVRGLGFGLSGVVTGALTATLRPPDGAVRGLACSASSPASRPLSRCRPGSGSPDTTWPPRPRRWRPRPACCRWRRSAGCRAGARHAVPPRRRMPGARRSGRMAGAALRLPLIFAAATIAAGVLDSFLPLAKGIPSNLASAALLVQAIIATLSRWQAGKHGDRYGHARLLIRRSPWRRSAWPRWWCWARPRRSSLAWCCSAPGSG